MIRVVYCDGACSGNGSNKACGGWAFVEVDEVHKRILQAESGAVSSVNGSIVTSNRMELQAVIEALDYIEEPAEVEVYTDSAYVANGISESWYKRWMERGVNSQGEKPKNMDLWLQLVDKIQYHNSVNAFHVKGHRGNKWNEIVDTLAGQKAKELQMKMR